MIDFFIFLEDKLSIFKTNKTGLRSPKQNQTYYMTILPATPAHIHGIITLQNKYLYAHLTAEERKKGFVTTPFTESQITDAIDESGLYVALDDEVVIGYVFAGTWAYFYAWPIFPFMIERLAGKKFGDMIIANTNTFQYGPVCIDEKYRGTGLFNLLFEGMRIEMAKRFPIGLTFINQVNSHSYHAHTKKLGLEMIETFSFNGNEYYTLAFDTSRSVLK
ncbi:MAG: GNAT family acetyltransferase [Saprospiraceae bacterium]|nr:GNAT family acetyltransferase [Saprospiraceae bacterium]